MAPRINWNQHIEAWQGNGLSQAAYCRLNGLSPATFSAKVREHKASPPPATGPIAPGLVPVRVGPAGGSSSLPAAGAGGTLVLRTASGHVLELPTSVDPGWVAELLRCLG